MSLWVIHHDHIMKGDLVISKCSPDMRPLIKTCFSKLCIKLKNKSVRGASYHSVLTCQYKMMDTLNVLPFGFQSISKSYVEERVTRLGKPCSGTLSSSCFTMTVTSSEVIHTVQGEKVSGSVE